MTQHRSYIYLSREEQIKFKGLGGSKWLKACLAIAPEPEDRPSIDVPEEERDEIARAEGRAGRTAQRHRVTVDFVYYCRRRLKETNPKQKRKDKYL